MSPFLFNPSGFNPSGEGVNPYSLLIITPPRRLGPVHMANFGPPIEFRFSHGFFPVAPDLRLTPQNVDSRLGFSIIRRSPGSTQVRLKPPHTPQNVNSRLGFSIRRRFSGSTQVRLKPSHTPQNFDSRLGASIRRRFPDLAQVRLKHPHTPHNLDSRLGFSIRRRASRPPRYSSALGQ